MRNLEGRTALITGASRGLGPYIARALAEQGMQLVLTARSTDHLEMMARKLQSEGKRVAFISGSLAEDADLEAVADGAERTFGAVDVLVNNAGIVQPCAYHSLSPDDICEVIRVNLTAPMLLARYLLPGMLKRGRGHIVNMASLAGKIPPPCEEPYAASKAGLIGFTRSLRAEYRGTGVSASVLCPGFVHTAGMAQDLSTRTGLSAPALLQGVSPATVAQAVVRAILRDQPEVIVARGPLHVVSALTELSPRLGAWIVRHSGADAVFRQLARALDVTPGKL